MYLEVSSTVPTVVMSHFGITQGAESAIYLQPNIPQLGTFALLSTAPAELGGARIRPSGLQQVCESAAANLPASTAVLMQPTGESRFLHVFWRRCCFGRWVPFPLAPTACPSARAGCRGAGIYLHTPYTDRIAGGAHPPADMFRV